MTFTYIVVFFFFTWLCCYFKYKACILLSTSSNTPTYWCQKQIEEDIIAFTPDQFITSHRQKGAVVLLLSLVSQMHPQWDSPILQSALARSLSQSQTSETKPDKEAKLWPFVDSRSELPLRSSSLLWCHSVSIREALPCRHIGRREDTVVWWNYPLSCPLPSPQTVLKASALCQCRDNGVQWALHRDKCSGIYI